MVPISKFVLCLCAEASTCIRCQGLKGRLSKGSVAAMARSLKFEIRIPQTLGLLLQATKSNPD